MNEYFYESYLRNKLLELASDKNTSAANLARLSEFKAPQIRLLVAGNPKTPLEIRRKLSKDKNREVRRKANEGLSDLAQSKCYVIQCYSNKF